MDKDKFQELDVTADLVSKKEGWNCFKHLYKKKSKTSCEKNLHIIIETPEKEVTYDKKPKKTSNIEVSEEKIYSYPN